MWSLPNNYIYNKLLTKFHNLPQNLLHLCTYVGNSIKNASDLVLLKVQIIFLDSCCLYSTSTLFEKNKLYLEQALGGHLDRNNY